MKTAIRLAERGLLPETIVRGGIRRLLRQRLDEQRELFTPDREHGIRARVARMRDGSVAEVPEKANEQHYEVPARFFELALGPRLKYSSAFYENADSTLAEAEEAMLELTCSRAGLVDGQRVLELGCGWGSLTLWMAERYPGSEIVAVSNSAPQREFIEARARERGFTNLRVLTRDMNDFETGERFQRVVSVEMFEHMHNWEQLLNRIAGWLEDDGALFLHFFAHRSFAYPFDVRGDGDWMSEHFFSGGMMPSFDLLDHLDSPFAVQERWEVPGEHYARTAEDWLRNLDGNREAVRALFREAHGAREADLWIQRWRMFFLACAELFAFEGGSEWIVAHQRLQLRSAAGAS